MSDIQRKIRVRAEIFFHKKPGVRGLVNFPNIENFLAETELYSAVVSNKNEFAEMVLIKYPNAAHIHVLEVENVDHIGH